MPEVYTKRRKVIVENNKTEENEELQAETQSINDLQPQVPLEMVPIIRAVRKYGLQTSALGLGMGIDELQTIEKMIVALNHEDVGIRQILEHVTKRKEILQETFRQSYGI